MSHPMIYAVIGIVLLILEMGIPGFVLLPIGVAFLLTAAIAYFFAAIEIQLLALAILAPLCLYVLRKVFHKDTHARHPTNFDGLVGKEGVVEGDIPAGGRGYVRVYGDSWKVEGLKDEALAKDTKVLVSGVSGTKIFIRKV